jgi:F-type H+-transporting ATPase subunit epsilon
MAEGKLPQHLTLEIVTPEGLLLREQVDDVVIPGEEGYFGVRPGHTPLLATLGMGVISYGRAGRRQQLTSFWGFCEVLPDRVNVLAEIGERAEDIDVQRAEAARDAAAARLKAVRDEAGYQDAHADYARAVTRLAVGRSQRGA